MAQRNQQAFSKLGVLWRVLSLVGAITLGGLLSSSMSLAQSAAPGGELESLTLVTSTGEHAFKVEVMRTDEQRARGLMFRRHMPADRGMLFDFKTEQRIMMWMRNTYIPLDMIFITKAGVVINVAEDTEPLSERTISSVAPAYSVLEVNAGTARRIGLKPGDQVKHTLFSR